MKVDSKRPPDSPGPDRPNARGGRKAALRDAAKIRAAVERLPEIREARIREIKWAVITGVYRVDPMKVAEKILREL